MDGTILAATGGGDLVVGLVIGLCLGILVGPAVRSWQTYREWSEASREARLADRLMETLEHRPQDDVVDGPPDEVPVGAAWRTRP